MGSMAGCQGARQDGEEHGWVVGSTAWKWVAWATAAQRCPPVATSLVASSRAQEGRSHLSPTFAHPGKPQRRKTGQSCLQAVVPLPGGLRAAGQQPAGFCSLLWSTEDGFCTAMGPLSPPGLVPHPAAPMGPSSLAAASWGQHASAAWPFSLIQGAQLVWDEGRCRER